MRREPANVDFDGAMPTDEMIRAAGGTASFFEVDVTDGNATTALFTYAEETHGPIRVAIANAGISPQPPTAITEEEYETYRRVMAVNVDGVWWTVREAARAMRRHDAGGSIVVMSSVAGLLATDSGTHYCASKGAVNQIARSVAAQMAPHQIRVNAVCPGFVRTAMTAEYLSDDSQRDQVVQSIPLGRVGEATNVAAAVTFLASDDAAWITGVALPVDGGYSIV